MLTDAQQQYFAAMESFFASTGWKLLKSDIEEWRDGIAKGLETVTPERLGHEQGRLEMAKQVLAFEENVSAGKAAAEEQNALEIEEQS